jgi:hypothetical protein
MLVLNFVSENLNFDYYQRIRSHVAMNRSHQLMKLQMMLSLHRWHKIHLDHFEQQIIQQLNIQLIRNLVKHSSSCLVGVLNRHFLVDQQLSKESSQDIETLDDDSTSMINNKEKQSEIDRFQSKNTRYLIKRDSNSFDINDLFQIKVTS